MACLKLATASRDELRSNNFRGYNRGGLRLCIHDRIPHPSSSTGPRESNSFPAVAEASAVGGAASREGLLDNLSATSKIKP